MASRVEGQPGSGLPDGENKKSYGGSLRARPLLGSKPLITPKPFSLQRNTALRSIHAPKTLVPSSPSSPSQVSIQNIFPEATKPEPTTVLQSSPAITDAKPTRESAVLKGKTEKESTSQPNEKKSQDSTFVATTSDPTSHPTEPETNPVVDQPNLRDTTPPNAIQKSAVTLRHPKASTGVSEQKDEGHTKTPLSPTSKDPPSNALSSADLGPRRGLTRNRLSMELTQKFESGGQPLPSQPPQTTRSKYIVKLPTSAVEPEKINPTVTQPSSEKDAEVLKVEAEEDRTGGRSLKRRISLLFDSSSRPEVATKKEEPQVVTQSNGAGGAVKDRIKNWAMDTNVDTDNILQPQTNGLTKSLDSVEPPSPTINLPEEENTTKKPPLTEISSENAADLLPVVLSTAKPLDDPMETPQSSSTLRKETPESSADKSLEPIQDRLSNSAALLSDPSSKVAPRANPLKDRTLRRSVHFGTVERDDGQPPVLLGSEPESSAEEEDLSGDEACSGQTEEEIKKEREKHQEFVWQKQREEQREKREEERERQKEERLRAEERERERQREEERFKEEEREKQRVEERLQAEERERERQREEERERQRVEELERQKEKEREIQRVKERLQVEERERERQREEERLKEEEREKQRVERLREEEVRERERQRDGERLKEEEKERQTLEERLKVEERERARLEERLREEEKERQRVEERLREEAKERLRLEERLREQERERQKMEERLREEERKQERMKNEEMERERQVELLRQRQREEDRERARQKEERLREDERARDEARRREEEEKERLEDKFRAERREREAEKILAEKRERDRLIMEAEERERERQKQQRLREEQEKERQTQEALDRKRAEELEVNLRETERRREVEERERERERLQEEQERIKKKEEEERAQERNEETARRKHAEEEELARQQVVRDRESSTEDTGNLISFDSEDVGQKSELRLTLPTALIVEPTLGTERTEGPLEIPYDDFSVKKPVAEILFDDFSVKTRRWGSKSVVPQTPAQGKAEPDSGLEEVWVRRAQNVDSQTHQAPELNQRKELDIVPRPLPPQEEPRRPYEIPAVEKREAEVVDEDEEDEVVHEEKEEEREEGVAELKDKWNSFSEEGDGLDTEALLNNEPEQQYEDNEHTDVSEPEAESPTPALEEHLDICLDDCVDVVLRTKPELPAFPESSTPLLDNQAQRSRVELVKRRSQRTRLPRTRLCSAGALQTVGSASTPDWRAHDTTEETAEGVRPKVSESNEDEKEKRGLKGPPTSQRVPVFPGLGSNHSALVAQLKRKTGGGGVETTAVKDMAVAAGEEPAAPAPSQPSRSPRSAALLPGAARVLPPIGGKDDGKGSSPSWLKELKKKKMSQQESGS
ncbi:unnamed protein product [Lota lota]